MAPFETPARKILTKEGDCGCSQPEVASVWIGRSASQPAWQKPAMRLRAGQSADGDVPDRVSAEVLMQSGRRRRREDEQHALCGVGVDTGGRGAAGRGSAIAARSASWPQCN